MKSASPSLIDLLDSNQFIMADLYTLTTVTGVVSRYTDYDIDLVVGGHVFDSQGPMLSRSRVRTVVGIEVDSLDLTIQANETHLLMGAPILQIAHNGGLDGARLQLERIFMGAPGDTSAGTLILFEGRVSDVQVSRTEAKLTIKSDIELLNIKMPRNLYQPGCLNTLFDSGCGLTKSTWGVPGTVSNGATVSDIPCSLAQSAAYFDAGTITFTSGGNAGVTRTVKRYQPGQIVPSLPFKSAPQPGDSFIAYPGCDKTQAACQSKFANLARFRGFPYVPIPETAI